MKKFAVAVIAVAILSFSYVQTTYILDKSASNVEWLAKKTGGQHNGEIKLQSGKLNLEAGTGEFVIDMNSLTVGDIKDADDNKHLVDHLRNEDFFGVEKFPTAKITIKNLAPLKKGEVDKANYRVIADLTIKGITNEITFPAQIDIEGNDVKAFANISIDRTKWKIVFKSKSIFSTLGDKFIYDDINFTVSVLLHAGK